MIDNFGPTLTPLKGDLNISLIIERALNSTEISPLASQIIDEASVNITNTKNGLLGNEPSDAGMALRDIVEKAQALSKYKALKGALSAYQTSFLVMLGVGIAMAVLAPAALKFFLAGWRRKERRRKRQTQLRNLEQALRAETTS